MRAGERVGLLVSLWLALVVLAGAQSAGAQDKPAAPVVNVATPDAQRVVAAPTADDTFSVAKVLRSAPIKLNEELFKRTGMVSKTQQVDIEILEGALKGKSVSVINQTSDNPAYNVNPLPGDEVIVAVTNDAGLAQPEINIADYHRVPPLAVLFALFLAVFLFFGGRKGFKSLIGLAVAMALVAFVLLPLSLRGVDPLLTAAGICIAATATTMLFVAGFTRKALAAVLGTAGGVLIAGVASAVVIHTAHLTGLASEEVQILRGAVLHQSPQFFAGLLAASMLIGALGVIMDVAVSVASSMTEVIRADKNLTVKDLYEAGMNVGRDIMGTMTSTLILAYAGSALPLLMLLANTPSAKLMNLDLVATEVAAALTGSIGLVCTIPLTAFVGARLLSANVTDDALENLGEQPTPALSSRGLPECRDA